MDTSTHCKMKVHLENSLAYPNINNMIHSDHITQSSSDYYIFEPGIVVTYSKDMGSTAGTCDSQAPNSFNRSDYIYYTVHLSIVLIISLVNIIGNSLVINTMVRHSQLRVPANYFILSLACSDICLGIVYPVYNVSHMELDSIKHTLGEWGSCTVLMTLTLGLLLVSSYNLVAITVVRFLSIRDPLRFSTVLTHRRALLAVVALWICTMSTSAGLYIRTKSPDGYVCLQVCRYEKVLEQWHVYITTFLNVLIPLPLMTCLYAKMTCIAKQQIHNIVELQMSCHRWSDSQARSVLIRRELRMYRMAGTLLGYYILAWFPYIVFEYTSLIGGYEPNRWIRSMVRLLLHSNTAVNVLIYAGRLYDFRNAIKKDCHHICPCRKPPTSNNGARNSIQQHTNTNNNILSPNSSPAFDFNFYKLKRVSPVCSAAELPPLGHNSSPDIMSTYM